MESEIFYIGDDWEIPFQYKEGDSVFDISTLSEIKACFKGATANIEVLLTATEITVTSGPSGTGVITFPKTKTINAKKGKFDLTVIRTASTGKEKTNVLEKYLDIRERGC